MGTYLVGQREGGVEGSGRGEKGGGEGKSSEALGENWAGADEMAKIDRFFAKEDCLFWPQENGSRPPFL